MSRTDTQLLAQLEGKGRLSLARYGHGSHERQYTVGALLDKR